MTGPDALAAWYAAAGARMGATGAPRTVTELVQVLGGPGRGGGTAAAAQRLGVDVRSVQRYMNREARGETKSNRSMDPAVERAFDAAAARMDRPFRVRMERARVRVSRDRRRRAVMDTRASRDRRGRNGIPARAMRPVLAALKAGDAQLAWAGEPGRWHGFEHLFLEAYGIPTGPLTTGAEIEDIPAGGMTIRR